MPPRETLGEFEMCVLMALMRLGSKAYGVTIRQDIEDRTDRKVSPGAVYMTLERMRVKGFVSSRKGEPTAERGGRAKTYFRIEAPGQLALNRAHQNLGSMAAGLSLVGA